MTHNFRISAIENTFNHLFDLNTEELLSNSIVKMIVDKSPGFPCRVSLQDAEIGEEVILLPFKHHKTKSPYQSSGPIFVRKNAKTPKLEVNEIPKFLNHRYLSLRGYNNDGMIQEMDTCKGDDLRNKVLLFLSNSKVSYIQIHNARPGCYNCQVNRVKE
ncbi:uncharacterized protein DUF1203 [Tenacibaculum gallaicum]|uniref:Uncharacterized protein DUF1203 n=1 Tax=Tenacibaculum gallaicum TaxID=561505 RepID=A0A3E0I8K8_9FLAO|nr:DUF1203 domain-containing protein [Tenacibaculum gallaicum]REH54866.1 uncharacterized protein DUF1203 [Tenacibaculum gallaicum]